MLKWGSFWADGDMLVTVAPEPPGSCLHEHGASPLSVRVHDQVSVSLTKESLEGKEEQKEDQVSFST